MAVPALAAALFGLRGLQAGKSLYNQFKGIGKRLQKSQQVPGAKVKKPQIKTAKPPKVKPTKVSVSPEEKSKVMSWFGNGGGAYKTGSALTPKANAMKAPEKIKGPSKRKATMAGKKIEAKSPGSVMFNVQGAIKKDLPKTPWKQNSEARDLFGL